MILEFYAVKDELANNYLAPTLMSNEDMAKRQFKSQINNIPLWKDNPADFSLWRLGTFDDESGEILYKPEKIIGGRSLIDA